MKCVDLMDCEYFDAGIVAFGFFDCIHLGHKAVIEKAISLAKANGISASVFLFKNNIFELIGVNKTPVFTFDERVKTISELGVDYLLFVDADSSFLGLSPDDYIRFLKSRIKMHGCVCGADFSFGKDGAGSASMLLEGIGGTSAIVDLFCSEGKKVSSDAVKAALRQGDLSLVESLLGRPFSIDRKVISGRGEGKKVGFPTLNFELLGVCMKNGVYFTDTIINGKTYPSITNVGSHPTFSDEHRNIESYVLDFNEDLYGQEVSTVFRQFNRYIVRYESVRDLIAQIESDVKARRLYD